MTSLSRRQILRGGAAVSAGGLLAQTSPVRGETRGAERHRVRQSIVHWCWRSRGWSIEHTCAAARDLGCRSVELVGPEDWPTLKEYGLVCAISGSHGFVKGMNHRAHWEECMAKMRESIDATADAGFFSVITFTGFAESPEPGVGAVDLETGFQNCVEGYKQIVGHAEKRRVTLCLEHLNSRVDEEMKGHPGYQGDHIDYCARIVRAVGSPRLKLLFDIYHVQIMDGDVIRRLEEHRELLGHIHTAGNPGRRELDDQQEIQYAPIMRKLVELGYEGFVGQEFIPTGDPLEGLAAAVRLCDV